MSATAGILPPGPGILRREGTLCNVKEELKLGERIPIIVKEFLHFLLRKSERPTSALFWGKLTTAVHGPLCLTPGFLNGNRLKMKKLSELVLFFE